jgi:hypothetical protein
MHLSQCRCHFWKQPWYTFSDIAHSSACEFFVISWSSEIVILSKWISVWEIRRSLLETDRVSRVAEEAQLCSYWPKSHESVVMHELSHCHDGGARSCFSTTEVFAPDIFS